MREHKMNKAKGKLLFRERKKRRIRKKIFGLANRPRLCVYKSNRYIYAQVIDDERGCTLAFVSSQKRDKTSHNCKSLSIAEALGQELGKKVRALGIEELVFDRSGYPYEGKMKALAEGARQEGLRF